MTVCVKQLGSRIPIAQILLVRALISLSITHVLLNKAGISPWGKNRGLLLTRGLLGTCALLCFFFSISKLPLGSATVLQYTYPTFTAISGWVFLHEKAGNQIILAVVIGWLGVLMVSKPEWLTGLDDSLPTIPLIIALTGALLTSLAYICVRKLSKMNEHSLVIIYYFPLISIPISLYLIKGSFILPTAKEWVWLIAIGLLTQLGQVWITKGLKLITAAKASAINYVQVIFATIWGYIIFHEPLDQWTIWGGLLVLCGTLISLSDHKKRAANQ